MHAQCPSCSFSASVPDDAGGKYAKCPECRTRFAIPLAVAQPGAASAISCPLCSHESLRAPANGLGERSCPGCGGCYLQADGMYGLVRDHLGVDPGLLENLQTFTRSEPVDCPGCRQPMLLLRLRDNDVDYCRVCRGLWLDGGELHRLTDGLHGAPAPVATEGSGQPGSPRHALETLLTSGRILELKQCAEMSASTVLFGWDHANFYDLSGPTGILGAVCEKGNGLGNTMLRNVLGSRRPIEAQVLDRSRSQVLLGFQRPPFLLTSTMEVKSPVWNRRIGTVRRTLNPLARTYHLLDATGSLFAKIVGPIWRPWTFPIYGPSHEKRGVIKKKWSGLRKEYYTRGDDFEIDFGDHPWPLEQRCVVLAAAISIDLDFFEERGADY